MSAWFANPDAIAAARDGVEWAPWVRYTRMSPVYHGKTTDEIAAYTPQDQAMNSAVHAVLYMSAGYQITSIVVHPPDDFSHEGRAQVKYVHASGPWLDFALVDAAGERAEDRWLRETGLWTPGRAWAAERHAWEDRSQVDLIMQTCHNRELTFNGDQPSAANHRSAAPVAATPASPPTTPSSRPTATPSNSHSTTSWNQRHETAHLAFATSVAGGRAVTAARTGWTRGSGAWRRPRSGRGCGLGTTEGRLLAGSRIRPARIR